MDIRKSIVGSLFLATTMSVHVFAAAHVKKTDALEDIQHVKMPSLHIHGSVGMGYQNFTQSAYMPLIDGSNEHYAGINSGYLFRPALQITSDIEVGETVFEALTLLAAQPTSSLINMSSSYTNGDLTSAIPSSEGMLYPGWALTAHNPHWGKLEAGKITSASAKAVNASFSLFHRLRGGYEDTVTLMTKLGTFGSTTPVVTPLITFMGATGGLLDAPHIGYTTPNFYGASLSSEYVPGAYLTDIGGVDNDAYAFTAQFQKESCGLRYDARASLAYNVINGFPGLLASSIILPTNFDDLVYGNQLNLSAAVAYEGIDASIAYGREYNNTRHLSSSSSYKGIHPDIIEGTLGYTLPTSWGAKLGLLGTYAVARDYARFYNVANIASSKGTIWGLGLGHFIGNMSTEFKVQRYKTQSTSSNVNLITNDFSGNIYALSTMYVF